MNAVITPSRAERAAALVRFISDTGRYVECDICQTQEPLGLLLIGPDETDEAAKFVVCGRCGGPQVERGLARWL